MAILNPTQLETIDTGTVGWHFIYNTNFEKINEYFRKIYDVINDNTLKFMCDLLAYNSDTSSWMPVRSRPFLFSRIRPFFNTSEFIVGHRRFSIRLNPNVIQFKEEKGQPNGYCPLNEDGIIEHIYLPPDLRPELFGSVKLDKTDCAWFLKEKLDSIQFIEKEKKLHIDETTLIYNFRYLSINPNVIQFKEEKGQPNGYCPLDENAYVPVDYIPPDISFHSKVFLKDKSSYITVNKVEYIVCNCTNHPIEVILNNENSEIISVKKIDDTTNTVIIRDKDYLPIELDQTEISIEFQFTALKFVRIENQWFIF